MRSWMGSWTIAPHTEAVEATVLANEKHIMIGFRNMDGTVQTIKWDMGDLQVAFDNSLQSTKISNRHESGSQLVIAGREAMHFIQDILQENSKPWHKKQRTKEWGRNLV